MENTGLGEAIGLSTGLRTGIGTGDFLRGMIQGEQSAFRDAQLEAKKAEQLRQKQEKLSRFITNSGQLANVEVQNEYNPVHKEKLTGAYDKYAQGVDATQDLMDLHNTAQLYKSIDKSISAIKKDPVLSKVYGKTKGSVTDRLQTVAEEQTRYFMPERLVIDQDHIAGVVPLKTIPTRQLNTIYEKNVDELKNLHKKKVGVTGNRTEYVLDVESPEFKDALRKRVDALMADETYVNSVKEGYPEYRTQIDELRKKYPDLNETDALEVVRKITEDNLNARVTADRQTFAIPKGKSGGFQLNVTPSGGFALGKFTYTPAEKGGYEVGTEGTSDAKPSLTGTNAEGETVLINPTSPIIEKYLGNDRWLVSGTHNRTRNGRVSTDPVEITVPTQNLKSTLGLTDEALAKMWGYKKPTKAVLKPVKNPIVKGNVR